MMWRAIGAVISVLVVAGCGDKGGGGGGGTGGTSDRVCLPGMSVACACTSGDEGAQVCTADGAGYGACVCGSGTGTAGTGGSGGGGGTGGSTGNACIPGMSVACACTSGGQGAQVCTADGAGYGACVCSGTGTAGTGGSGGSTGGTGGSAGGTGGSGGVTKRCSTWTTVLFADFNDGTRGGLTDCFGCSAAGCANVVGQQLYMPSQWNLVCYPGLSATETRAIRISYDVTDQGKMGGMGWDNFGVYLKTNKSGATCGDGTGTHGVSYAADVASLVGHWELIRWGGNSFQFNLNAAPLGQIECALPALSGMAVDFHEGGGGVAQSKIDNFRVEVCSAP